MNSKDWLDNDMAKAEKNQDKLNFAGDYVLDVAELLSYQIAQGGPGRGG